MPKIRLKSIMINMVLQIQSLLEMAHRKISSISQMGEQPAPLSPSAPPDTSPKMKSSNDFVFLRQLGEGSFSTVYLGREVATSREFAIKVCDKAQIKKEKKVPYVLREKEVMTMLIKDAHPFLVQLYCTFQDSSRLYFVMTLAKNKDLHECLRKLGSFDLEVSQFYAAEIVTALEHIHKLGIVHRDLKPENILLSHEMHILVSDFGSAKVLGKDEDSNRPTPLLAKVPEPKKRSSFVGTAHYVSPEVLNGKHVTPTCDYWALGCIIYQMLSGLPPFLAPNDYLIFQKIVKLELNFPEGFLIVPKELVQGLLLLDPEERLGCEKNGGIEAIKSHAFFENIEFEKLTTTKPPTLTAYLPAVHGQPELHGSYSEGLVCSDGESDEIQPGFDDATMSRLLNLGLRGERHFGSMSVADEPTTSNNTADILSSPLTKILTDGKAVRGRLFEQRKEHPYHRFVEEHLILKSGFLEKKKGLFARKRMFLLTEGPHLYYVDPVAVELKGEVPLSKELKCEPKNFKIFFVHTPNRIYYLEDTTGFAQDWCTAIEDVCRYCFHDNQKSLK